MYDTRISKILKQQNRIELNQDQNEEDPILPQNPPADDANQEEASESSSSDLDPNAFQGGFENEVGK